MSELDRMRAKRDQLQDDAEFRRRSETMGDTAYHEAGHAVAAYVTGRPFEYVTIKPDVERQSFGHVRFGDGASYLDATTQKRQREIARAEAVVMLAGPLAAYRWIDDPGLPWRVYDVSQEEAEAEVLLQDVYVSPRRVREVLGEALTRGQQLVAEEWAAIEALAEALLARETLRYAEVCEIIRARLGTARGVTDMTPC